MKILPPSKPVSVNIIIGAGVFLLIVLSSAARANHQMVLSPDMGAADIGIHMDYMEDAQGRLRFSDLQSNDITWIQSHNASFNFGFTSSAYWFRLMVQNPTTEPLEWFLEINYPLLDRIDLFIPETNGEYTKWETGDHFPFHKRMVPDRNFIFRLLEQPGKRSYYIRIQTSSSLNFSPIALSTDAYIVRLNHQLPIFWVYNGLMMIMVLYNLLLYLSVKDRSYLYYVLFIGSWIIFTLSLNGFAFQFFWPNAVWWANNCIPFFICNALLWLCQFERSYARTKADFPMIDNCIFYGAILPTLIWLGLTLFLPYALSIKVATALVIWGIGMIFGVNVILFAKGSRPARYIVISFTMVLIGVLLYALKTFGVLPANLVTNWGIQLGATCVVVLLSLGLADKINTMANDLFVLNEELEHRVHERTTQLENANKALTDSLETLKITQKQLVQSEKMAALGGLVAGVAHEINTPLSVGITAASLLEDKTNSLIQQYATGKIQRSVLEKYIKIAAETSGMILNNLNRAAELVKSFKQVAVDQSVEDLRKFNIKSYVQELLVSLRPRLKKGGHHISFVCPDDLTIMSYPGALSQIITNLVMNSLIHGFEEREGGDIYLEFRRETKRVVLIYSDNGRGMDQKTLGKIFDPFFTTKRSHGGTGLGMHILYNLVTQTLGGQMECTSSPGEGVVFLIQLPSEREPGDVRTGFTTL
ncbi:MAG: sensor histidine kinase [Thermodesulfobacteriota bacterium]